MKAPIHLNALRAFEASARHQSFSDAADELHVTPAAVGQLVRTLEDWLGAELFHRMKTGKTRLIPTEAAESALPAIRAGFDKLTLGVEQLQQSSSSHILTVAVSPAFAAKWLLPRMERFHEACSDTDVRLDTSLRPLNFLVQKIDIGVRYGLGTWPDLDSEKMMEEEVYPVCSPSLLKKKPQFTQPEELLKETLIHDLSLDASAGFPTWSKWFNHLGIENTTAAHNMQINNAAAVLQTAIDGGGVALARSVMVKDDIASGRLIRLFPEIKFDSPLAYYIVYRPELKVSTKVNTFKAWLHKEVERF